MTPPPTVEQLFLHYRSGGDVQALAAVFDRTAPEVMRLAAHLAASREAAEDLVQNTFLAAIESAGRFERGRRLVPWLLGILVNHARRDRARRAPLPDVEFDSLVHPSLPDPLDRAAERELSDALARALDQLRDPTRQALELYLRHGLSPAAIAKVMRRPQGTVRSWLHRGLDELRRRLPAGYAAAGAAGASIAWAQSPAALLVRDHVLAAGHAQLITGASAAIAGAALVKKPIAIAAALAVLTTFAAWFATRESTPPPVDPTGNARVASATDATSDARRSPSAPPVERRPAEAPAVPSAPASAASEPAVDATRGSLVMTLRWKDDQTAAGGIAARIGWEMNAPPPPRYAIAEADGTIRVTDLAPGRIHIRTLAGKGFANASITAGVESEVSIDLQRGLTIDGTVVDTNGRAVADANIWLSPPLMMTEGIAVAHSDARGKFTLEGVDDDNSIGAWRPGFGPAGIAMVRNMDARDEHTRVAELELRFDGASVAGRVVDPLGTPIPDAEVRIQLLDTAGYASQKLPGWVLPPPIRRVLTDSEGRFASEGLAPGRSAIVARAGNRCPTRLEIEFAANVPHAVELQLSTGATIRGIARDADGKPVSHTTIRTGNPGQWDARSTMTRVDGAFSLAGIQPGAQRVEASTIDRRRDAATLELVDGQVVAWNPVLRHAGSSSIRGRVTDDSGEPLVQWGVKARGRAGERTTATDRNGEFTLVGLQDTTYELEVREPMQWLKPPVHRVPDVMPSSAVVAIRVPRAAVAKSTIIGRLVDASGTVPSKCAVRVWPEPLGQPMIAEVDAATGGFRVEDLPAGTYRITLQLAGASHHPIACTTRPGETFDAGTIQFTEPGTLVATASLPDDAPLAGARGIAIIESELTRGGHTSAASFARNLAIAQLTGRGQPFHYDGHAFVSRLAPGSYRIRVWGENFVPLERSVTIEPGRETAVTLELAPAVRHSFTFDIPKDAPRPTRLLVRVTRDAQVVYDIERQSLSGTRPYSWSAGFALGQYTLHAETNTGLAGRLELNVVDGQAEVRETIALR